ncbi:MAG: T9SS type A sorting domain-containing protein [Chlorobi bacterium]|nr:T9SS type A sorting domain-containing protein [Chlorobiota bacterium]
MKKLTVITILTVLACASLGQTTLQDSLQLYYLFNGDATDLSGHGHDGVVYGATLTTNRFGQEDGAYEFNGFSNYINSNSTFDFVERSVSLWVSPYDISGITPYNHVVISQDDYRLKNGALRVDFDNSFLKLWAGGANNLYVSEADKMLNKWSHIVLIRNEESTKYYINATLVYEDVANNIASTYEPDSNFIIGTGRSTYKQFFKGKIDDVRIYNRVLTDDEIKRLFIYDITLGIEEIVILSNINNSYITIINKNNSKYDLRLIDICGRILLNVHDLTSKEYRFYKPDLPKGLYFIQLIQNNKQTLTKKIVF